MTAPTEPTNEMLMRSAILVAAENALVDMLYMATTMRLSGEVVAKEFLDRIGDLTMLLAYDNGFRTRDDISGYSEILCNEAMNRLMEVRSKVAAAAEGGESATVH